ncbi:hypothetical protein BDFB_005013 [Asbolus verrucosus]|uniref:Uncharacterized protein n=1 Tax=Asbolus verrucosus TaxID=1661398 RepID=A0A482W3E2_ASBVE|nr:hypothetical protein BDFB_005013 [Asbolus verrucosus]
MNFINTLTIVTVLFSIAKGQTTDEIPPEDYIVQLKFKLREERIPAIVNYLLNNSLVQHDISTEDIIQLSKLDRYNLEETTQAFNYFNISAATAFSVDTLEAILGNLEIDFGDFYRSAKDKLGLDDATTQQVLKDLSINQINFLMALANQGYIYDTLRDGNYDEEHVNAALTTISKNRNEVYVAVKDTILETVLAMNSSEFMAILKENGWNRRTSYALWEALNITTRDVYEVEKFRNIFTAIYDSLNRNLSIAVFVDRNKLATHEQVYKHFDNNVDGITIKIEAEELEVEPRQSNKLGTNIVELTTKQDRAKYIEITESYNSTENCTYVTFIDGNVNAVRVEVDDSLSVQTTGGLTFNLGSPLTCQGYLYGLAREEKDGAIIFDKFYLKGAIPADEEEELLSGGGSINCSQLLLSLIFNLFFCFVLL